MSDQRPTAIVGATPFGGFRQNQFVELPKPGGIVSTAGGGRPEEGIWDI